MGNIYIYIYIYIYSHIYIGIIVFASGPRDRGSILGRVTLKTQKMLLETSMLNTQHYKLQIKGKWSNPNKEVPPKPTPWCGNYWKGSLRSPSTTVGQLIYIYIILISLISPCNSNLLLFYYYFCQLFLYALQDYIPLSTSWYRGPGRKTIFYIWYICLCLPSDRTWPSVKWLEG